MTWFDHDSARFPRLLRFLGLHAAIGGGVGAALAVALIASNVGGLLDLLWASDAVVIGSAMLVVGFVLTFSSAAMGTAIMMLPRDPSQS